MGVFQKSLSSGSDEHVRLRRRATLLVSLRILFSASRERESNIPSKKNPTLLVRLTGAEEIADAHRPSVATARQHQSTSFPCTPPRAVRSHTSAPSLPLLQSTTLLHRYHAHLASPAFGPADTRTTPRAPTGGSPERRTCRPPATGQLHCPLPFPSLG